MEEERKIVLPGDIVDESGKVKAGQGVFKDGDKVYAAQIGIAGSRGDYANVVSFKGPYEPRAGDFLIGKVMEYGPSNWVLDINSPYVGLLSADSVPWRVEIGETGRFLGVGDMIVCTIAYVDGCKKIGVSMRDRDARKVTSGIVIRISPSKIPRLIGKSGSMVATIKKYTNTRIFAGQNGRIWIDGTPEGIAIASNVVEMIDREAHTHGLTDRVEAYLKQNSRIPVAEPKPVEQHAQPAEQAPQEQPEQQPAEQQEAPKEA